jgi:hypothetical protein
MIILPGDYTSPPESDRTPIRITVLDLSNTQVMPFVRYRFVNGDNYVNYEDTHFAYSLMSEHFIRFHFTAVDS